MSGTATIFVDFNRRHPAVRNRFFTYIHELPEGELGDHVIATDWEDLRLEGRIVGIDYDRGELMIDVEGLDSNWAPGLPAVIEAFRTEPAAPGSFVASDSPRLVHVG